MEHYTRLVQFFQAFQVRSFRLDAYKILIIISLAKLSSSMPLVGSWDIATEFYRNFQSNILKFSSIPNSQDI